MLSEFKRTELFIIVEKVEALDNDKISMDEIKEIIRDSSLDASEKTQIIHLLRIANRLGKIAGVEATIKRAEGMRSFVDFA